MVSPGNAYPCFLDGRQSAAAAEQGLNMNEFDATSLRNRHLAVPNFLRQLPLPLPLARLKCLRAFASLRAEMENPSLESITLVATTFLSPLPASPSREAERTSRQGLACSRILDSVLIGHRARARCGDDRSRA